MNHGTMTAGRVLAASRPTVYDAWTALEHRRVWFKGPEWTEIERSVDLRVGGGELAHGRFPTGVETIYTARFHVIEPNVRLIFAFNMQVGGAPFSVSLACVEFADIAEGTELTYTEDGYFFADDYDAESRSQGTAGLLDGFASYVHSLA